MKDYRGLVIGGLAVAVALAILSYATPTIADDRPTLQPRSAETWRAETILLISESGFPEGRAVPEYRPSNPKQGTPPVLVGDQERLSSLAALYSQYASSDRVRRIALREGPLDADVSAEPVTYTTTQFAYPQVLPLIRISSTASTPDLAIGGASRIAEAFTTYIGEQQGDAKIPVADRVVVDYARRPDEAVLVAGRSKILPAVVFFSLAALLIGGVLVLDNVRRGSRGTEASEADREDASETYVARVLPHDETSPAARLRAEPPVSEKPPPAEDALPTLASRKGRWSQ